MKRGEGTQHAVGPTSGNLRGGEYLPSACAFLRLLIIASAAPSHLSATDGGGVGSDDPGSSSGGRAATPVEEEEGGLTPLSDRLLTELSAHRTVALRRALGERPDLAILAALHALCLKVFYAYTLDTCLGLDLTSVSFGVQVPGLADSAPAIAISERQASWRAALPSRPEYLWAELQGWDGDSRDALFAHCMAMGVNACTRRGPGGPGP